AALPSLALLYDQFILGTLHERVGDQEQVTNRKPPRNYLNGGWLKGLGQNGSFHSNGIYKSGPSFDYNFEALQFGVDIYHASHQSGSSSFAGILGSYGHENGNVTHLSHTLAGHQNFNAWSLGGYFTHYDPHGWYIDNVLLGSFHYIN